MAINLKMLNINTFTSKQTTLKSLTRKEKRMKARPSYFCVVCNKLEKKAEGIKGAPKDIKAKSETLLENYIDKKFKEIIENGKTSSAEFPGRFKLLHRYPLILSFKGEDFNCGRNLAPTPLRPPPRPRRHL